MALGINNYAPVLILVLVGSGCGVTSNSQNSTEPVAKSCSEKPDLLLEGGNVKVIALGDQLWTEKITVSENRSIGYTFEAKAGQKLEISKNPGICTWVFTADNQVFNGEILPKTGKYTVQISALQGSTNFDLALGLDTTAASPSPPTPISTTASIPSSAPASPASPSPNLATIQTTPQIITYNFPMAACGDKLPDDPSSYPIEMYPVRLPPGNANLRLARSRFCQDAYEMTTADTKMRKIQVASFTTRQRAIEFMNILNTQFRGATVETPTKILEKPSSVSVEPRQIAVTTERVEFGVGKVEASIQGEISSSQQKRYLLWCGSGQSMAVQVQQGNVDIAVIAPDGQAIGHTKNESQWRGQLPSSGDYVVQVSTTGKSRYTVRVEII